MEFYRSILCGLFVIHYLQCIYNPVSNIQINTIINAVINKTGAIILLTATTELIVEISSVECVGPNVFKFLIFLVPVPTSTSSKSFIASLILIFIYSIISSLFSIPIGLYPLDNVTHRKGGRSDGEGTRIPGKKQHNDNIQ